MGLTLYPNSLKSLDLYKNLSIYVSINYIIIFLIHALSSTNLMSITIKETLVFLKVHRHFSVKPRFRFFLFGALFSLMSIVWNFVTRLAAAARADCARLMVQCVNYIEFRNYN